MEKRYQVFVSSTFEDLIDERKEVMQALLELKCMPAGMEMFPAADDDQWSLIKGVIDDSDYYLVVLGGRYGSIGPGGLSYTELEYRYALEQGKPIIGFVHANPGSISFDKSELTTEGREKLDLFRTLIMQKTCKHWNDASDLGGKVSRGVINLMSTYPGVGWVRADSVTDSNAEELLKYRRKIDELEAELATVNVVTAIPVEELARGSDEFELRYEFLATFHGLSHSLDAVVCLSWDTMFAAIGPVLINGARETQMRALLNGRIEDEVKGELLSNESLHDQTLHAFSVSQEDLHTVILQFRSLGLIVASRVGSTSSVGWILTARGDQLLAQVKAVRRPLADSADSLIE